MTMEQAIAANRRRCNARAGHDGDYWGRVNRKWPTKHAALAWADDHNKRGFMLPLPAAYVDDLLTCDVCGETFRTREEWLLNNGRYPFPRK